MRTMMAVVMVSALAGCGGDDGVSCSFSACGGDPVGDWHFVGACAEGGAIASCPDATFDYGDLDISGDVSIKADMSYSSNITISGTVGLHAPSSCLPTGATCDAISNGTTVCAEAGDGCDCTSPLADASTASGTWSTSGNSITLQADGATPDTAEYCVQGNQLKVHLAAAAADEPSFTYVLTR
jgi:hypothetical protein